MSIVVDAAAPSRVRALVPPWAVVGLLAGPLAVWLGLRQPLLALGLLAAGALVVAVALRPAVAAYALIVVTPLTAGIDRGAAIPLLRPNEALAAAVAAGLVIRALLRAREGARPSFRPSRVEWSMLAMAVASSVVPLTWMALRHQPIGNDDLLYALVLWKLGAVYLIVRTSIHTDAQVRRCLQLSVGVAGVVAVIAVLQALDLFHARALLSGYYVPNGNVGALANPRGGSTLALPAAMADLMILNLAVVAGLVSRGARHRVLLSCFGGLFALAAVASGEFSSAAGLVLAAALTAVVIRRPRLLFLALPLGAVVAVAAWPVISTRLAGFQGVHGMPVSWTGRLHNLQSYFLPELTSRAGYLLGVRPSARVTVPTQATGFVWIESGYVWLLWGGGIPLLVAFVWFVRVTAARALALARTSHDAVGAAGTGLFVAVVVMAVLMLFDPHLTYRGAGDALFILAALARPLEKPPAHTATVVRPEGAVTV